MAKVSFTVNLQRHVQCQSVEVAGDSVAAVLQQVFVHYPALKRYVVDDQFALRKHMNVFVDGEQIVDRVGLSDSVNGDADIYVMQALSGG